MPRGHTCRIEYTAMCRVGIWHLCICVFGTSAVLVLVNMLFPAPKRERESHPHFTRRTNTPHNCLVCTLNAYSLMLLSLTSSPSWSLSVALGMTLYWHPLSAYYTTPQTTRTCTRERSDMYIARAHFPLDRNSAAAPSTNTAVRSFAFSCCETGNRNGCPPPLTWWWSCGAHRFYSGELCSRAAHYYAFKTRCNSVVGACS